jgi:hypothetical protein
VRREEEALAEVHLMSEAVEIIHDDRSAMLLPSTDPRRLAVQARAERLQAEQAEAERAAARKVEPPRSLAERRAALAQAITARDKAEQAVSKLRAASAQANRNADAASKRLEAARAAADKAHAEHIERAEQAARDGKPLPAPGSLYAAEVANATKAVEFARAAGTKIAEQLSDLEGELRRAQDRVAATADDVIRSISMKDFVAQTRAMQNELISRRLALLYLLEQDLVCEGEWRLVADLLHDASLPDALCVNRRVIQSSLVEVDDEHDGAAAWRQARAALARDADAPLPV